MLIIELHSVDTISFVDINVKLQKSKIRIEDNRNLIFHKTELFLAKDFEFKKESLRDGEWQSVMVSITAFHFKSHSSHFFSSHALLVLI